MSKISLITELNDHHRTVSPLRFYATKTVQALDPDTLRSLMAAVQDFNDFSTGDDPYGEHDFGAVSVEGERYFWKIEYYDLTMDKGSEDPSDPSITRRVLTIMHCSEY